MSILLLDSLNKLLMFGHYDKNHCIVAIWYNLSEIDGGVFDLFQYSLAIFNDNDICNYEKCEWIENNPRKMIWSILSGKRSNSL